MGIAFSSAPGALQIITDVTGNPEEERRAAFYHQPWAQEAVGRHIFAKVRRLCPGWPGGHTGGQGGQPGLSRWSVPAPGAAAKAGTGTGAGNPPDLTAQGPLPFFPAWSHALSLEGDHPLGRRHVG